MLLAIDVGNTQTVLGLYEPTSSVSSADAGLVDYWRIGTDQDRTSDEHAVLVRNLLRQSGRDLEGTIKGVAVCAGVPRVLASLPLSQSGRHQNFSWVTVIMSQLN